MFIWNLNTTKLEKVLYKGGHEYVSLRFSVPNIAPGEGALSRGRQPNRITARTAVLYGTEYGTMGQ